MNKREWNGGEGNTDGSIGGGVQGGGAYILVDNVTEDRGSGWGGVPDHGDGMQF